MPWDMAVFDEAHRLRRDDNKITQGYQFADQIASRVDALLLLSATPFRGKLEELYYLIHLLDPHLLGSVRSILFITNTSFRRVTARASSSCERSSKRS
jgi:SNF2 family DNA or RNA helicase